MIPTSKYQVRTDRSLVDVAYRLLDTAAILASALAATRYTDSEHIENLAVVGATTRASPSVTQALARGSFSQIRQSLSI